MTNVMVAPGLYGLMFGQHGGKEQNINLTPQAYLDPIRLVSATSLVSRYLVAKKRAPPVANLVFMCHPLSETWPKQSPVLSNTVRVFFLVTRSMPS
jgi:hypothetical protein